MAPLHIVPVCTIRIVLKKHMPDAIAKNQAVGIVIPAAVSCILLFCPGSESPKSFCAKAQSKPLTAGATCSYTPCRKKRRGIISETWISRRSWRSLTATKPALSPLPAIKSRWFPWPNIFTPFPITCDNGIPSGKKDKKGKPKNGFPFLSSAEPFPILPRLPLRHRPEFPSIWDLLALHCFVPGFLPLPALLPAGHIPDTSAFSDCLHGNRS